MEILYTGPFFFKLENSDMKKFDGILKTWDITTMSVFRFTILSDKVDLFCNTQNRRTSNHYVTNIDRFLILLLFQPFFLNLIGLKLLTVWVLAVSRLHLDGMDHLKKQKNFNYSDKYIWHYFFYYFQTKIRAFFPSDYVKTVIINDMKTAKKKIFM